jgi:hypothetical protein
MQPVESLEVRRLLASFTAVSVTELVVAINAANAAGGSNTITLAPGASFKLTSVDNTTSADGPNGLPVIAAGNALTIVGNGDVLQRSTGTGTPAFRLFDVASGGSLTLNNLTLSRGLAWGYLTAGGAILNEGTLSLSGVTVQNCLAQGPLGSPAFGGGIYSSGTLAIANSAIQNNQALGGDSSYVLGGPGAMAAGGGVYIAGGSATVANCSLSSNLARGGNGGNGGRTVFSTPPGPGGAGLGGAIYAAAGTVRISGSTITRNTAKGGSAGTASKGIAKAAEGVGQGGGIYIASGAVAGLDAFTQANTQGNTASTSDNDIFGSFTLLA